MSSLIAKHKKKLIGGALLAGGGYAAWSYLTSQSSESGKQSDDDEQREKALAVDFDAVRKDILAVMDSPLWDDGSYAPVLIRLGWHASGTYNKRDGSGGSDGGTMRHALEANDPDNAGLGKARELLSPIQAKHPGLTYADLWILASYCAIEHTGGPRIEFQGGRIDAAAEKAVAPGRLPNPEKGSCPGMEVDKEGRVLGWEKNAAHVREVFGRMGFSDEEMVALICGGHVYGRCHTESSGYAGAWVENPTRWSNEYARDMFEDQWILVSHDSKLPDGRPVPEEVRPAPGKRQYIDWSKLKPDEEASKSRTAPDSQKFPPGRYECVSDWVNFREQADTGSPIIGRCVEKQVVNLVAVKVFGSAIRGQAERGGWVSIIGSGGKELFARRGELDAQTMQGKYRRLKRVPTFSSTEAKGNAAGEVKEEQFTVSAVVCGTRDGMKGAVYGLCQSEWALLYSPLDGQLAELIVEGYNDIARKPIKSQEGNQMMLISDMVMKWDPVFQPTLQKYADSQEFLSKEFGKAFKRLTELGCPWSKDGGHFKPSRVVFKKQLSDTDKQRQKAMSVNFDAVRKDILEVMDSPLWDDGSYAPVLIRLGWHASGTYDKKDGSGGSDGATMRHELEANDPDNAGLGKPRELINPIKAKHPGLTFADLWVLASYCAIEHTGGPKIPFQGGRIDASAEKAIAPGRLPNPEKGSCPGMEVDGEGRVLGWEKNADHVRDVFGRMGFTDREMVALICGGHVYGRCHTESSGYAGAWVENPTRFSNEYARDMFEDTWILIDHNSKLPDGRPVPEEVRPAPGKRQYIDWSKLMPDEEASKNRAAPDSQKFPPGKYECVSDWVNFREKADTGSPIIGRCVEKEVLNLVAVKVFGTAIRGQAERGGWVSIIGSGGKELFARKGDLDFQSMQGKYRRLNRVPKYSSTDAKGKGEGDITDEQFSVASVSSGSIDGKKGAVYGKVGSSWALLYSPQDGQLAELIVEGYNTVARKPIKAQEGNQMMLISDMVMKWDPAFQPVLKEYADDQDFFSKEFGRAFKRLTELGCPWSKDGGSFKPSLCFFFLENLPLRQITGPCHLAHAVI